MLYFSSTVSRRTRQKIENNRKETENKNEQEQRNIKPAKDQNTGQPQSPQKKPTEVMSSAKEQRKDSKKL